MKPNIFEGERIRLRALTQEDIERDIAKTQKMEYDTELDRLCDTIHPPYSVEQRKDDWEKNMKHLNTIERCNLVIETLDNIPVGGICVTHADQVNGTFSYGLAVSREHWRKGYASEAIKLFLNYYFNELRFHKCNVTVYDYNSGSKALHASLGFTQEGRQRESKYTNGEYFDVLLYGMTRREFCDKHRT